jgi:site-specific DNA recombinase
MKTKKESKRSHGSSSEPWRNIKKGEVAKTKATSSADAVFRIGPYIRLSPSGDDRLEGSLVSHPQRIRQFIESKNLQHGGNWGAVVEWYEDKDLSGKDMNRPAFQKMLKDIESGRINAVVVTELSRLNRKVKDFLEVWEFFKEKKVAFFSLKENFDTSTPMGELMLIQSMSFAQFERQTIVERIVRGSKARAERGLANGCVLLGFKLIEHRPNHREIDEVEKPYVEMIFRKFLELKRLAALVNYLNENGYRTKEFISKKNQKKVGGKRWTLSSIHSLITNRAYIGEREINKLNRSVDPSNLKDDEKYYFVDASWPALVSQELFFDVQRLLEQNRKKARRYVHDYRLTGLIECAECGASLVGKSAHGQSAKYFYYGHKRKMLSEGNRHKERCHIENIPSIALEEAVIARVKDLSQDRALVKQIAASTNSQGREKIEHQKALLSGKEQERRKVEQRVKNLQEAIADETDRALRLSLAQTARESQGRLDELDSLIAELKGDYARISNVVDISNVMSILKDFREGAFDALPVSAQADILKSRIRRIVVRENGIYVEIFGAKTELGPSPIGKVSKPGTTVSKVRTVFKLAERERFELSLG